MGNRQRIFDALCELAKTVNSVTTSAMATVDGSTVTFDTGGGYTEGKWVVQIQSIGEVLRATAAQGFSIQLRGSNSKAFTSEVVLAQVDLGYNGAAQHSIGQRPATATIGTPAAYSRYIKPFCNEWDGKVYQYLRCYHAIDGTVTTGISYISWITKA